MSATKAALENLTSEQAGHAAIAAEIGGLRHVALMLYEQLDTMQRD
jgi:hypothetical protein